MSKPLSATDIRAALAPWLRMSRAFQQLDEDAAALQVEDRRLAAAKQLADGAQGEAAKLRAEVEQLSATKKTTLGELDALAKKVVDASKALDETQRATEAAKVGLQQELDAARAAHAKGLADDLKKHQAALEVIRDERAIAQRELDAARGRVRDFQAGLTSLAR